MYVAIRLSIYECILNLLRRHLRTCEYTCILIKVWWLEF